MSTVRCSKANGSDGPWVFRPSTGRRAFRPDSSGARLLDHGVYVTAVHIPSFGRTFTAVTNIGVRPTVYQNSLTTVESHLLDFTADVYQERVRLFFLERVREERTFASTMQLMTQIRADVAQAREFFEQRPIDELGLVLP